MMGRMAVWFHSFEDFVDRVEMLIEEEEGS
jgi:hypothetical protein